MKIARKLNQFAASLVVVTMIAAIAAPQTYAFNFQEFVGGVQQRISNSFQRVYLALPGNKAGDVVVNQAFNKMNQLESVTTTSTTEAKLLSDSQQVLAMDITVSGPSSFNGLYDIDSVQQDLNIQGALITPDQQSIAFDADLKVDGSTAYFKVNQLPEIPQLLSLKRIEGQWLGLDMNQQLAAEQGTTLTAEQQRQLVDAYLQLFESASYSTAEKQDVNGQPSYVVDMTLESEQILAYVEEVLRITEPEQSEVTPDEFISQITPIMEQIAPITSTITVDRSTLYVTEVSVPLSVDLAALVGQVMDSQQTAAPVPISAGSTLELAMTSTFSEFNQPVEFEVPENVRPFEEVFQQQVLGVYSDIYGLESLSEAEAQLEQGGVVPGMPQPPRPGFTGNQPPAELQQLSPAQLQMLKEYGIDPSELE